MAKTNTKLLKQRLQRAHVGVGISFSLLMYIAVFFGIFAILLPYIQIWEKPSRHFETANLNTINYSSMIDPVILDPDFPKNNIIISLPGYQNDPALRISHQFVKAIVFNPRTEKRIQDEGETSNLASFLNGMHYGRPLKTLGYLIFGFMAVGGMFLIIGGVILVSIIKFSKKGKNQQSKFSLWHRKIFTWIFPPFIIITLTGALMNIGFSGASPMTYVATHGQSSNLFKEIGPVLFPEPKPVININTPSKMLPITVLINKAQEINPDINFQQLTLVNWNDESAQIKLKGYNPYLPFLNGTFNKPIIVLNAKDGSLVKNVKVLDKHWTVLVTDSLFFLHFLFGVDIFSRFFIAAVMASSTFAIGFGVMLWLEKKAKKFEAKIPFYHWMGKLSLTIMIGVIPASGVIFALQWLLPFDLYERVLWQQGIFFISWLATLTWSFYRVNSYQAAKEFLFLGAVLFIVTPILHFFFTGWNPISLYTQGLNTILNVDIALFIFGTILMIMAKKIPKNREEAKIFWTSNEKGQINEK